MKTGSQWSLKKVPSYFSIEIKYRGKVLKETEKKHELNPSKRKSSEGLREKMC